MIEIDGSYGEGGGQIIRTSVSLSAITGKAVRVYNVRAKRTKPGLQPQHAMSVKAAASICGARVEGASQHSRVFVFEPGQAAQAGKYRFEIGTAGAVNLVAQTVLLPLAPSGESEVVIVGGTHVPHSPVAEYLETVYLPALTSAGLNAWVGYEWAGFYPVGGGELNLFVKAAPHAGVNLTERGKLRKLTAYVVTGSLPDHVAERGAATIQKYMKAVGRPVSIDIRSRFSRSPGAAVVLTAECDGGLAGFTSLGERGKPMEKVAEQACDEFMKWWKTGAAVDEHLADQLVLPMCLVDGESRWTTPAVTEHLRTVLWVVEQFLPIEHRIEERESGVMEIVVNGQGIPM